MYIDGCHRQTLIKWNVAQEQQQSQSNLPWQHFNTHTHTQSERINADIMHRPQGNIWNEVTKHVRPWGQKVKRRESFVCPGCRISPLTTKITPQFPDCHHHNHNNPPVHFCSCAFKCVAIPNIFPLQQSTCQNQTNNVTNSMRIFSVKMIQSVQVRREEGGREKTDSRMKQQAEGHRISSALHPARSQSRGTTARAKDAQARAKLFSSKQRPPIVPV